MDNGENFNYNAFVVDLCGNCRKESSLKCSQCNIVSYCSVSCQRRDRKKHKRLMQCLQDNPPSLEVENRIMFGELLNSQIFLTYVYSGDNHYFGENEIHIDGFMKTKSKMYTDMGLKLDLTNICEQLMDQPIFKTFEGDVYYHNMCFGLDSSTEDGHLPTQDPIKISSGDNTKTLTPEKVLKIMAGGVPVTFDTDSEFYHYASSNMKPLFMCTQHNSVSYVEVHQFVKGVLLLFNCH